MRATHIGYEENFFFVDSIFYINVNTSRFFEVLFANKT